jgi:tRNA A-37 threonylcarbamoyl transferase component Bud32
MPESRMTVELDPGFKQLSEFVENIRGAFPESGTVIYQGRNTLKAFQSGGVSYVVKAFKVPHIINQISYGFFRHSKAERSYVYGKKLCELGISTPSPIGYVEYRRFGLLKESYYISEQLHDVFEIRDVFADPQFADRENILRAFAGFCHQLHSKDVLHYDFSAGNILIQKSGGTYQFSLVDVNRMEFVPLSTDQRIRSMAKLGSKEADSDTVAKYYAEAASLDESWCVKRLREEREAHWNKLERKNRLRGKSLKRPDDS